MRNPILIKSYYAPAAVAGYLILKPVAGGVGLATAATDLLLGVSDAMGAAAGGMVDVTELGRSEVLSGGVIAHGDPLTSDGQGRAIKAVPAAAAITRIIGFAVMDANLGDIFEYSSAPGIIARSA